MKLNHSAIGQTYPSQPNCISDLFTIDPTMLLEFTSLEFKPWQPSEAKFHGTKNIRGVDGSFGIITLPRDADRIPSRTRHLQQFIDVINSTELTDFVSKLTGEEVQVLDIRLHKWTDGDYLAEHTDVGYRATLVLYLSPYWDEKWGGILEFSHNDGPWKPLGLPQLGSASFCSYDPDWSHRVSPVTLSAPIPRLSAVVRYESKESQGCFG